MELDCGNFNENEKLVIKESVTSDAKSANTDKVKLETMVVSSQENVAIKDIESGKDTEHQDGESNIANALTPLDDNNCVTLTACMELNNEQEVENGETSTTTLNDIETDKHIELPQTSENDPIDSVNNSHERDSTSKQVEGEVNSLINDDEDDNNDIGDDEKEEENDDNDVEGNSQNNVREYDNEDEGESQQSQYADEDDDVDSEGDSTAGESYSYNQDEDDDVAVVLDSSDEDQDAGAERDETFEQDADEVNSLDTVDDADEDYDYDDLMDDVAIGSTSKKDTFENNSKKEEPTKNIERKFTNAKIEKRKNLLVNWRMKLKKRSLRWLNTNRMHHVDDSIAIPIATIEVNYDNCSPQITSTPKANPIISTESIQIDIDSSPEKSIISYQQEISTQSTGSTTFNEMQQVDKISDSIKKSSEDLKQSSQLLHHGKTKNDDHNKENVENNDKETLQKTKENFELLKDEQNNGRQLENTQHLDEVMEISDEICVSSETNVTVIENKEMSNAEDVPKIKDNIQCDTISQILVSKTEDDIKETIMVDGRNEETFKTEANDTDIVKDIKYEIEENSETSKQNDETEATMPQQKDPVEQLNPPTIDNPPPTDNVETTTSESGKRSRSASFEETTEDAIHPTKKLRAQLENQFPTHDQILTEYIEKTSNTSVDEIQKHLNQLIIEIQTLTDMIKTKEIEWNNMLHLKKVKEEICYRLTRKKQIMEIMTTKVGEIGSGGCTSGGGDVSILASCVETLNNLSASNKLPSSTKFINSTPNSSTTAANINTSVINNLSNISAIPNNLQNNSTITNMAGNSIVQSILQNRANMKSSDLAKEKANTQRLHRNILPKPSSATATGSTKLSSGATSSPIVSSASGMVTIPVSFGNSGPINLANSIAGTNGQQPILNNYLTATATVQQQLGEMLNGHHNSNQNVTNGNQTLMVGRQGAFKDVKSIIADYRQKHPEVVPRRGRRMKSLANMTQAEANSILGNVLKSEGKLGNSDLGTLLSKFDGNSRPSSNDSSHSMTNAGGAISTNANVSFKDALVQYAKMSGQNSERLGNIISGKSVPTSTGNSTQAAPPPYPEVTLHPVSASQATADQSGSLLHGILTKYTRPNQTNSSSIVATSTTQTASTPNYNSSFSPTLARLLTAPERITSAHNSGGPTSGMSYQSGLAAQVAAATASLNLSKVVGAHNSEITITPVVSTSQQLHQTLQQQLQNQQIKEVRERLKYENFLNIDDEADDSIDRLVIDEGGDSSIGGEDQHRIAPHAIGQEFHENEVPICQGCKKQEAQFVCAGCGNQWYCSRECQVAAWDEHSEVCTG